MFKNKPNFKKKPLLSRLLINTKNDKLVCFVLYYDKSLNANLTSSKLFLLIIRLAKDLYSLVGFKMLKLTIQLNVHT